jgi:hypothetical protein
MANLSQPFDSQLDEQNKNQNQQQSQQGPQQISGGQSASLGGGGAAPGPVSAASTQANASGRYQNLSKYMNANKDFNQGQGLAGLMNQNIGQAGQKLQSNVQGAQKTFQDQSGSNIQGIMQAGDVAAEALKNPYGFAYNQPQPQNLQQPQSASGGQPAAPSLNQANIDTFAKARDAQYGGPKGLQDISGDQNLNTLQSQASNIQSQANQTGTESGRYNLLRTMFNKPTYSKGQQGLDQLLIQGNQQQLGQLKATRSQAAQAVGGLNQTQQQAEQQAKQYQQQAQGVQEKTRQALTGATTGFQSDLDTAVKQAKSDRDLAYQTAVDNATQGKLSNEDISRLGLTKGQNLYGLNLGEYISKGDEANKYNVANQDQYNKAAALAALGGVENTLLPGTGPQKLGSAYSFKDNLNAALSGRKAEYEGGIADVNSAEQAAINQAMSAFARGEGMPGGAGNASQIVNQIGADNFRKLLESGQLGSLGAGGNWGYKSFGEGGGHLAQQAYQDAMKRQAELNKYYGIGSSTLGAYDEGEPQALEPSVPTYPGLNKIMSKKG